MTAFSISVAPVYLSMLCTTTSLNMISVVDTFSMFCTALL